MKKNFSKGFLSLIKTRVSLPSIRVESEIKPVIQAWEMPTSSSELTAVIDPPRQRGRPRKYGIPVVEGKFQHSLSDEEPNNRSLLKMTEHKIKLDFKEYIEEGVTQTQAINCICDLYKIPYDQAFKICDRVRLV